MYFSEEQLLKTAALCHLDLSLDASRTGESPRERVKRVAAELDAMVASFDALSRVDTDGTSQTDTDGTSQTDADGVLPLYSPLEAHLAPPRADAARQDLGVDEILANAPKRQQNFFAVPPVL